MNSSWYPLRAAKQAEQRPRPRVTRCPQSRCVQAGMLGPLAVLLNLVCGAAHAQPRASVPPGCGSDAELLEGLRHLIGDAADTLAVQVEIRPGNQNGLFTLELSLADETRTLRDADCRTLFRSAIVVAAASVSPAPAQSERAHPASARIPLPRASTPASAPAPASASPSASSRPAAWRAGVALGGGVAFGLLPAPAPRFELSGDLEREPWGAALALHFMSRVETIASSGHGVGVHAFGGRALGLLAPWRFLRFAAGAEVALQQGAGIGSQLPLSDSAWLVAGVAEIAAIPLRLGHARLELALAGQWNVLRPRFEILGYGRVYRVAGLGGSGLIRLGWTFL